MRLFFQSNTVSSMDLAHGRSVALRAVEYDTHDKDLFISGITDDSVKGKVPVISL